MGPGTPIVTNIYNGVQPLSPTDAVAKQHDIDYLTDSRFDALKADLKAISKTFENDASLQAWAMRLGLGARMTLNSITNGVLFNYQGKVPNLTEQEHKALVDYLNSQV